MTSIPLVRMLTDAGYGSRREASKLVNAGLVEVNGHIASSYTAKVDPEVDSIVVTGNKVAQVTARRVYLIMNKPEGYLSTTEDDRDRPTVLDLLPENVRAAGLHPAGRLDEDSTGLLVLTNDGQLTYELTHPRFEHEKEYWVATTGRLTDVDVERLEQGVEIEEQMTWPARVRILLGQSPYTYSITIHEGRKRQIRMMLAAIGQQVAMLKRVRLGGLLLGELKEGEWRELTPPELKELMRKRPVDIRQSGVGPTTPRGAARLASVAGGHDNRQASPSSRQERAFAPRAERAASPVSNAQFERRDSGPYSERSDRPPMRERSTRTYEGSESRPSTERPYRRATDDRGPRDFERRDSGPYSERSDRPPMRQRDTRPYQDRESRPPAEQPYQRPAADRGPRDFERRDSRPYSDRRDRPPLRERSTRTYEGRESRPSTERPYRRATDDRGPRDFERRDSGPYSDRSDRPPMRQRDTRPYQGRESRPSTERPYRRPADDRGPRDFERTDSGPYSDRRDRPPMRQHDTRTYEGRESRPSTERPYRRPVDDRGPRAFERTDSGPYSDRRDRPPARAAARRPFTQREPGDRTGRPYLRPAGEQAPRPYTRGPAAERPRGQSRGPAIEGRSTGRPASYSRVPHDRRAEDDRRPRGRSDTPIRQAGRVSQRPRLQARAGRGTPPDSSSSTGRRPQSRR